VAEDSALRAWLHHGMTPNNGFAERGEVPGDAVIATGILPPLLHHGQPIRQTRVTRDGAEGPPPGLVRPAAQRTAVASRMADGTEPGC